MCSYCYTFGSESGPLCFLDRLDRPWILWEKVPISQRRTNSVSIHSNRVLHFLSKTSKDPASAYGCYHRKIREIGWRSGMFRDWFVETQPPTTAKGVLFGITPVFRFGKPDLDRGAKISKTNQTVLNLGTVKCLLALGISSTKPRHRLLDIISWTVSFSDVSELRSCLSDWVDWKHLGMLVSQICIYIYIIYIYTWIYDFRQYYWMAYHGEISPEKMPTFASGTRAVVFVGCLGFTWLRTRMAEGLNSVLVLADDCHSNECNVEWGQWIRGTVQFLLWKDESFGVFGDMICWMKW